MIRRSQPSKEQREEHSRQVDSTHRASRVGIRKEGSRNSSQDSLVGVGDRRLVRDKTSDIHREEIT